MIGLTSYLDYAIAQKKDLSYVEGIIIYPVAIDGIPQEVFFIPGSMKKDENFNNFLIETFSNRSNHTYVVYFQGIRWIMPDIEDVIKSMKPLQIEYGTKHKLMSVGYGKITFDKTHPGDPDVGEDLSNTEVPVLYNKIPFILNVTAWPNYNGIAKLFERLDF